MATRRSILTALACTHFASISSRAEGQPAAMTIHKDPNCGCCQAWADRVGAAGVSFRVVENKSLNRLKAQLGVPQRLASCHTAEIAGYVIEGHVPPAEIQRLLREKPRARGLAVPGMPVNSPGMEVPGASDDTYDVVLFGADADVVFARYSGARKI